MTESEQAASIEEAAKIMRGESGGLYALAVVRHGGPRPPAYILQAIADYLNRMDDGERCDCLICDGRLRISNTGAFVVFNAAIANPGAGIIAAACSKCAVKASDEDLAMTMADDISPGKKPRFVPPAAIPHQVGHA